MNEYKKQLQMKFNPGTLKYEPELPKKKNNKKRKIKIDWRFIGFLIIILIILLGIFLIVLKNYPY